MPAVTVRRATFEDAKIVAKLAHKLILQHTNYNPKRFIQIAEPEQMELFYGNQTTAKDAAVLVAEANEKIVGFAFLQFEAKNYAALLESAVWLHDLYVDEAARGLGAGKSLIEAAVKTAKELGANKLMLSVAAQNEVAQTFFERIGFKTTMVEMWLDLTELENFDRTGK